MEEKRNTKNREATEDSLLKAVDELVSENGFENLGVNAVASRAGVSKMLIYRYFGSLEGLITAYIRQYDFWINFDEEFPDKDRLGDFIKAMFSNQIRKLRENNTLRKFYRWELSSENALVKQLRDQREEKGVWLVETVSNITGRPKEEIAVIATLLSASISYLSLLEETCDVYNGIPIQEQKGWDTMEKEINRLIDNWMGMVSEQLAVNSNQ